MTMGKLERPDRVISVEHRATITNYFCAPRQRCNTITDDEVDRLMKSKLAKERKLQEHAWRRREEALKASLQMQLEEM